MYKLFCEYCGEPIPLEKIQFRCNCNKPDIMKEYNTIEDLMFKNKSAQKKDNTKKYWKAKRKGIIK